MKVLILTASYGTGHVVAAKALDEAFRKKGITPTVLDLVEIGGGAERGAASFYSFLMKRGHFIWKFYHDKIMPINRGNSIRSIFSALHKQKFFKDIEKVTPDLIISTMDTASVVASLYKQDHKNVKIATVLTDYVAHPLWVWKNMDYYFVGSEGAKKYLVKNGIDSENITISGIPLRLQFEKVPSKKEARKTLGIPEDKTVVLLSVGSFDSVPIPEILDTLENRADLFFLILAGNEEKVPFYAQLLQENNLIGKVAGYTDQMEIFMSASDLFISKAGGITTAECLTCSLPAVYLNNFPGHEIGNAEYVEKNGAGIVVRNKKDLAKVLEKLLGEKEKLMDMSKSAGKISRPSASSEIVSTLL